MSYKVCCFNDRLLVLLEVPPSFKFDRPENCNCVELHQSLNLYPNFIQKIARDLERLYKTHKIVAILYRCNTTMANNFPNGIKRQITYYVYYTTMDDCVIDDMFYDQLLTHLTGKLGMSYYVAQVFLQSLRHGYNKPDQRIDNLINKYQLQTHSDNLADIRQRVLNLTSEQKRKIETLVTKNSTFNSILPNMLLLNVTNCTQQESLSIKYMESKNGNDHTMPQPSQQQPPPPQPPNDDDDDVDDVNDYDDIVEDNGNEEYSDIISTTIDDIVTTTTSSQQQQQHIGDANMKFKSYLGGCRNDANFNFQQHTYYCSYMCGKCVIVSINITHVTFNMLIMRNIALAFYIVSTTVGHMNVYFYIDKSKFDQFAKIRIRGKILQYTIHDDNFSLDPRNVEINYRGGAAAAINFTGRKLEKLFSTAPLVVLNTKSMKDSFKTKIKIIQLYLIVCKTKLHCILENWNCICKVLRIITSPYNNGKVFYHILIYINELDTEFLYNYLPTNGMDNSPCLCDDDDDDDANEGAAASTATNILKLTHSQKLWLSRPCIDILFHTHFDWTIMQIHNDFLRRPNSRNIFRLYDVFETGKLEIAHLLETKVFKATIENLTTFKFFHETGFLYPSETSGYEEMYIYTLIKMARIVYRCIVLPLSKMETLVAKTLIPSKFPLTYNFIDDPLTPTTSVRGPQSTRNLKSIESSDRLFDTKVINVTMLTNSFNLCGSESSENTINM